MFRGFPLFIPACSAFACLTASTIIWPPPTCAVALGRCKKVERRHATQRTLHQRKLWQWCAKQNGSSSDVLILVEVKDAKERKGKERKRMKILFRIKIRTYFRYRNGPDVLCFKVPQCIIIICSYANDLADYALEWELPRFTKVGTEEKQNKKKQHLRMCRAGLKEVAN